MERIITKQEVLKLTCEEYQKMMSSDVSVKEYLSKEYYENNGYRLIDVKPYDNMQFYNFYYLTTYTTVDIDELEKIEYKSWIKEFQEKQLEKVRYENIKVKVGDIINIKPEHQIFIENNGEFIYCNNELDYKYLGDYEILYIHKVEHHFLPHSNSIPEYTVFIAQKIDDKSIKIKIKVDIYFNTGNNQIRTLIEKKG